MKQFQFLLEDLNFLRSQIQHGMGIFGSSSTWPDERLAPKCLAKWQYNRMQNRSSSRATSRMSGSVASTALDDLIERIRTLEER